jgi:tetratricopeptide (TPR) repeat protein
MKNKETLEKWIFVCFSILVAILTVVWCIYLGDKNVERVSLALITCSAAFALGSIVGFLFSIFGGEEAPFGKIRNAVIALASGIAGIGIAKVNEVGAKIGEIDLFGKPSEQNAWFSALFVITYAVAGFYFMYLLRLLVLNPALAKSQKETNLIQLSGNAGKVASDLGKILKPSVLLGRDYIADIVKEGGPQAEELQKQLFGDVVNSFLDGCEKDLESGSELQLDNITKAAVIHYYRAYFESEDPKNREKREMQLQRAIDWINRALLRDPLDPEFNIKLADIYGMQNQYEEAVSILERMERDEDSPQYVQQWLGYFLLYIEGREMDSIRHSLEYYERFRDESACLLNASRAYAQLYTQELQKRKVKAISHSKNRQKSLKYLEQAVKSDAEFKAIARKHAVEGDSFESLVTDNEFKRIIEEAPVAKAKPTPA